MSKRPRTTEPDLTVVVEDERFEVHSLLLMLASPVFKQMLTSDMAEGTSDEVVLPDKKKDEFAIFYACLQLNTRQPITLENAHFLVEWADEYQVNMLKDQCEDLLLNEPVTVTALTFALSYGLERRAAVCVEGIQGDVAAHMGDLHVLISNEICFAQLWPAVCTAADVTMERMPDQEVLKTMWPFVLRAVWARPGPKALNFLGGASSWRSELTSTLPPGSWAVPSASAWINGKVKEAQAAREEMLILDDLGKCCR